MKTFDCTITDAQGIHARPAGLLAKEAQRFCSDITITHGEKTADAKRLFALMGLGVRHGDTVRVTVSGCDENEAAEALEAFIRQNL